ncbi:MAG: TIGR01777 family oxidoreductase [Pseudomonadales bacterium]|jgi:uncharacterized protein (TIGR01777 family)|nr:TIGR01777 family oxidoreductase [Pseudomonadales bacterium]
MDQDPTRVLVTGGSGFVGRHLVPELVEAGAQVTVLTRSPARAARVLPGVDLVAEPREAVRREPAVVINLAGAGIADRPWSDVRRQELLSSRVAYTERLCEAFAGAPPRVLVSASAVGFYGVSEEQRFVERDPVGAGFAADLCARWERAALGFEALGTRVALARIGLVLGRGGLLARLRLPFSLGLGGPIGDGRQWMSWIHMADVVGLLRRLADDETLSGPVNLTAPNPVRNADFSRALGAALRRPAFLPVPAPLLRLVLGQMAEELLLSGAAVLPERAEAAGYQFRHETIDDALAAALGKERKT